jgi:hypothetical protein
MNRVDLYIDGQRVDFFDQESIELTMSVQNVKDISKVFGDFSKSFTLPASPNNNAVFKHYYNVDVSGGFDANTRTSAFIELNNNVFRSGVIELEGVQLKNLQPYAYKVGFYSKTTSLKDLFGEDTLNDLDLSAQDHAYNDTNIVTGLNGYVSGTDSSIIYPLITPVANWYYNSASNDHESNNISYHSGHSGSNPKHGVFYYDLKPAIKLQKIIDAIEAKYGVTFNSDFFDSADFGKLFMWCHRRAGYMFKDQPIGATSELIELVSGDAVFDSTLHRFPVTSTANPALISYSPSATASTNYRVDVFINDELFSSKEHTGNASNVFVFLPTLSVGDYVDMRLAPSGDGAAVTVGMIANWYADAAGTTILAASATPLATTTSGIVTISDQMPEQKIVDFFSSTLKAFNLVVVPTSSTAYDIEPLDDWYAEGITRDVSKYVDITEATINKPSLYKRVSYKYNETEAILGEQYRLQNDIGYGDLRADFDFDGDEFEIEVDFDHMLFERLSDQNGGALTTIGVGKSITRELDPYIGSPLIFYVAGQIRGTEEFSYVDMADSENLKTDFHLVSNLNSDVATDVTKTLNFGTEIDPYLLQGFSQGLYSTYWQDYITDLYDVQRRLFSFKAQLPIRVLLDLKSNDKLTILERNYIINSVTMNLATGEAQLELLNDV